MATCKNCNKELNEGALFCDNCGTGVEGVILCRKCGTQLGEGINFCQKCGTSVTKKQLNFDIKKLVKIPFDFKKLISKLNKKIVVLASGAVALLLVAVIVLSFLLGGPDRAGFVLYFSDGEMYHSYTSKISPVKVTNGLILNDSFKPEDLQLYDRFYSLSPQLCLDGESLFYVDQIDYNASFAAGNNLYLRNIKDLKKDPVKIDSDIYKYYVSQDGKRVTYIKGFDADLYSHNLKDKEKVASGVTDFKVSQNGMNIVYLTNENSLYFFDNEKEKIEDEVQSLEYVTTDCKTVYYLKDDILYSKTKGGVKAEIASSVTSVVSAYDSGEIYYTKKSENKFSILEFIDDDMSEADAALIQPTAPIYPSLLDFKSQSEYNKALEQYNTDYLKYTTLLDEYTKKLDRDIIRQALADSELTNYCTTLYYYDGNSEKLLSNSYCGLKTKSDDRPLLVFSTLGETSLEKIKISEINYAYEVEEIIETALNAATNASVALKGGVLDIELAKPEGFVINQQGDSIYFLANLTETKGNIYTISVSANNVSKPKAYDINVARNSLVVTSDDRVIYFKDVDADYGDLYVDLILVDYDVNIDSCLYSSKSKAIAYMTDYVISKKEGKLKVYKGGKPSVVSEDVYSFTVTSDGKIAYLYDYNNDRRTGELKLFNGKKSNKVADDVTAIFSSSLYIDHYFNK